MIRFCFCFCFYLLIANYCGGIDFTVASYNSGGLPERYDYIRAVCMQQLVQERFDQESENLATLEKLQSLALKMRFSNKEEQEEAKRIWDEKKYDKVLEKLTSPPGEEESVNAIWNKKSQEVITPYDVRPIVIRDSKAKETLTAQISDLLREDIDQQFFYESLDSCLNLMATRIFDQHLHYDIIALQESDYLTEANFPEKYQTYFKEGNGIAWNKERFHFLDEVDSLKKRSLVIRLLDKTSNKVVAIASAHLSGCNPFTGVSDQIGRAHV